MELRGSARVFMMPVMCKCVPGLWVPMHRSVDHVAKRGALSARTDLDTYQRVSTRRVYFGDVDSGIPKSDVVAARVENSDLPCTNHFDTPGR